MADYGDYPPPVDNYPQDDADGAAPPPPPPGMDYSPTGSPTRNEDPAAEEQAGPPAYPSTGASPVPSYPAKDAAPLPDNGTTTNGNGGDVEMRQLPNSQTTGNTAAPSVSQGASSTTALNQSSNSNRQQQPAEQAGAAVDQPTDGTNDVNKILSVPDWIRLHPLLGAYLAECLGTFVFVLTVALVEINNPVFEGRVDTNISSLPVGFMFMCMVLTFGYISGGHFNPAITMSMFLYERASFFRYLMYIVCQCGSALGAGIVAMIIKGDEGIVVPDVNNDLDALRKSFFAELVITFGLSTVVLNVAHRRKEPNLYSGMACGFVMTAGVAAVGGVKGGAFNPALATGLQLAVCFVGRCTPLMHFWMYWAAPAVGAILGAILFSNLHQPLAHGDDLPPIAPNPPVEAVNSSGSNRHAA